MASDFHFGEAMLRFNEGVANVALQAPLALSNCYNLLLLYVCFVLIYVCYCFDVFLLNVYYFFDICLLYV